MALSDPHQLQVISDISEALSSEERRRVFYMCEVLVPDNSVSHMKEMLKGEVMRREAGHLLLEELMLHLRRFELLRKVCKTSREAMERTCAHRTCLQRFRVVMDNISEEMDSEDINSLKFLLSDTLSHEKLSKIESFLDVITELEKLDMVSPERVDFVEKCLMNIGRVDLSKQVNTYRKSAETPECYSAEQQQYKTSSSLPSANHPVKETRQGQVIHCASENTPLSTYREESCQSQLDLYKFNTNPRGVCVIIDCVGNDGDMLEQTFKALLFTVVLYKWMSVDNTLSALRGISRQRQNFESDGFVCCIISRGTASHLLGTDSYGMGLHLDKIRRLFTADACPMLVGKPKLFFIQRYGVVEFQPYARLDYRDEDLETDGCQGTPRCDVIPTDADVFWSHCWTDEHQLEQEQHHSIYLKALTDALRKGQGRKTHLVDLHTRVNGAVFEHNKNNPGGKYHIDVKHTLRKDLYLQ
ncbi:CASP8 and FADD-like apoptosis regulator isoform X2 [Antennarius striatus]|uniref:CASP8 and FADD-like apoptosis regulator isoform X2 n=1 Tax=Antennarius striatus TaxID=241820 RepID=UPI0035AE479F